MSPQEVPELCVDCGDRFKSTMPDSKGLSIPASCSGGTPSVSGNSASTGGSGDSFRGSNGSAGAAVLREVVRRFGAFFGALRRGICEALLVDGLGLPLDLFVGSLGGPVYRIPTSEQRTRISF